MMIFKHPESQQPGTPDSPPRHVTAPPDWAQRLHRQRHGTVHQIDPVNPTTTALLVIDMQKAFVDPAASLPIPYAPGIIEPINRMARALREHDGLIIWIQTDFSQERHAWSEWFGRRLNEPAAKRMITALSPSSPEFDLHPEMQREPGDLIVIKTRFSPFPPGASGLEALLRERGIDTLLIAGTVSNTCCESTARDAMMLNFRTVFLVDANAARTDDEHQATLGNMLQVFADVATVNQMCELLGACKAEPGHCSPR